LWKKEIIWKFFKRESFWCRYFLDPSTEAVHMQNYMYIFFYDELFIEEYDEIQFEHKALYTYIRGTFKKVPGIARWYLNGA
jgi:hypothetical protein